MFKPWSYKGWYYDRDINLYIEEKTGLAATIKWMGANKNHLRIQ